MVDYIVVVFGYTVIADHYNVIMDDYTAVAEDYTAAEYIVVAIEFFLLLLSLHKVCIHSPFLGKIIRSAIIFFMTNRSTKVTEEIRWF